MADCLGLEFYRDKDTGAIILADSTGHVKDYKSIRSFANLQDKNKYEKVGDRPDLTAKCLIEQGTWMFEQIKLKQNQKLGELTQS